MLCPMKKLLAILVLGLWCSNHILAEERSEKEIKMGVFLEDLESIGTYKKIEQVPVGLFDKKYNSFTARAHYSLSQIGVIFVKQKGLLEKYPSKMMKGMAYFEFFYQQQLKDNKRAIENFEKNYPTWDSANIKSIQKLHSLNKARKSMREALGLSLDDDIEAVLSTQFTMYKLFEQSNTSKNKLTKDEKKLIKIEKTINKEIGKAKALVEKRNNVTGYVIWTDKNGPCFYTGTSEVDLASNATFHVNAAIRAGNWTP